MAGEHQVGGGLALPGVGVDVAAAQTARLAYHQLTAVSGLAHHFIGGGEVQNDRGPSLRQAAGGGIGSPQVLADLHAYLQSRHGGTVDNALAQAGIGRGAVRSGEGYAHVSVKALSALEPPLLIELPIVGQVGFRRHRQYLALLDHHGAVVELPARPDGHPQGGEDLQVPRGLQDGPQSLRRALQQRVLQKQVAAGVSGETQLRQGQNFHALHVGLAHHGENLLRIMAAVRHADLGRAGGDADESVLHSTSLLKSCFCRYCTPKKRKKQHPPAQSVSCPGGRFFVCLVPEPVMNTGEFPAPRTFSAPARVPAGRPAYTNAAPFPYPPERRFPLRRTTPG